MGSRKKAATPQNLAAELPSNNAGAAPYDVRFDKEFKARDPDGFNKAVQADAIARSNAQKTEKDAAAKAKGLETADEVQAREVETLKTPRKSRRRGGRASLISGALGTESGGLG